MSSNVQVGAAATPVSAPIAGSPRHFTNRQILMVRSEASALDSLIGRQVVLDVASQFVYVGTLHGQDDMYLILADADVHDLRDSNTTREAYVHESKLHGVGTNRRRVLVRRAEIVSISALEDVVS